ncbi:MAG TPA: protein-methionine-sulfoxide reductase heme-binding subunit MsrQ, partial [Pseudomonas sp.]|nr:protein-methionine-sulfoxide reductase heme-binding subunit MsrQ [Pseudomonas sp.]
MRHAWLRVAVFLAALSVPLYWLYLGWLLALGPEPGKWLSDHLGQGALLLLLLTLAMTPLSRLTGWPQWLAIRRQLGLWSFVYAGLHIACFGLFILGAQWERLPAELLERPYVMVGALAFLGMLALALTSNGWSMRRLGSRWKRLHRLIYPILLLVLLHMLWVVRSDLGLWVLYASLGGALLVFRTPWGVHWSGRMANARRNMTRHRK